MMKGAVLETPRLTLRPFTVADTGDVYAYAKDPRVGPIAGWPAHQSYFESWEIVRTVFSEPGVFAMELKENRKVVGSVGFVGRHPPGVEPDGPEDEIGYALSAAYWGRGLAAEAVREVLRWGFQDLGMKRIWCGHYAGNRRSERVIEKCGFRYVCTFMEHVELMREDRQAFQYVLTKEDWRGRVQGAL